MDSRMVLITMTGPYRPGIIARVTASEGITLSQVIAIGDGANDLPVLGRAGLGIAFNVKTRVHEQAEYRINQQNLGSTLYLLDLTEKELAEVSG